MSGSSQSTKSLLKMPISLPESDLPSNLQLVTRENLARLLERASTNLVPVEPLSTREWAEQNLKLPDENADIPGDYSLEYAPYLIGIFHAADEPSIPEIACMKAAQVAWTTGLIAMIGRRIENTPMPMVGMFAAEGAAREFNDEKFTPIVEASPALASKVDVSTSRKSGNRALFKKVRGWVSKARHIELC